MILLPALFLTAVTGQWANAPLLSWTIIAVAYGGAMMIAIPLYRSVTHSLLCWLGIIVESADLRRLVAWENRWYSRRLNASVSAALTLGTFLALYLFVPVVWVYPIMLGRCISVLLSSS
jgi:hypothetical protein